MTHTQFAIIIPAYNAGKFINETLNSVVEQTLSDWRAVVVDDGSTDDTAAIVRQWKDSRISMIQKQNGGVSSARNAGLAEADADFIVFLDADDLLASNALERFREGFTNSQDAVLVYGEACTLNHETGEFGVESGPVFAKRPSGEDITDFLVSNPIPACCAAIKSDICKLVGAFDTSLSLGEDWEFFTRVVRQGSVVYLGLPAILTYLVHGESATRRLAYDARAMGPAIEKVFAHPDMAGRFSLTKIKKLKRLAEGGAFAFSGSELIKVKRWPEARRAFLETIIRRPLRLREWILLFCACVRWLPDPIRKRIK